MFTIFVLVYDLHCSGRNFHFLSYLEHAISKKSSIFLVNNVENLVCINTYIRILRPTFSGREVLLQLCIISSSSNLSSCSDIVLENWEKRDKESMMKLIMLRDLKVVSRKLSYFSPLVIHPTNSLD